MPKRRKPIPWEIGQKIEIARRAKVSPAFVTLLTKRQTNARPEIARRLEKASKAIGRPISKYDWMDAVLTDNENFE